MPLCAIHHHPQPCLSSNGRNSPQGYAQALQHWTLLNVHLHILLHRLRREHQRCSNLFCRAAALPSRSMLCLQHLPQALALPVLSIQHSIRHQAAHHSPAAQKCGLEADAFFIREGHQMQWRTQRSLCSSASSFRHRRTSLLYAASQVHARLLCCLQHCMLYCCHTHNNAQSSVVLASVQDGVKMRGNDNCCCVRVRAVNAAMHVANGVHPGLHPSLFHPHSELCGSPPVRR
mmetsp:Transcript_17555/g.48943  ORF Transcript_17555/g.48943 Transcript_17555/m.48943 type:complete len:232 (-) Transcript_17555:331-1026(-)